jgi:serine/threonine protein kinase
MESVTTDRSISPEQVTQLLERMEKVVEPTFLEGKKNNQVRSALITLKRRYVLMTLASRKGDACIKEGRTKQVKKAISVEDGKGWALGIIRKSRCLKGTWPLALREVRMMELVRSKKGLIQLEDWYCRKTVTKRTLKAEEKLYLVMEDCDKGNLNQAIQEEKEAPKLTFEDRLRIMGDIVLGVYNLHALGIVHRDLKHQNIFLQSFASSKSKEKSDEASLESESIRAKVADLGFAAKTHDNNSMETLCGTPRFMAPEKATLLYRFQKDRSLLGDPEFKQLIVRTSGFAGDVWSLGIILYELLHPAKGRFECIGTNPELTPEEVCKNLADVKHGDLRAEIEASGIDSRYHDLLIRMLNPTPNERPTMESVLQTVRNFSEPV